MTEIEAYKIKNAIITLSNALGVDDESFVRAIFTLNSIDRSKFEIIKKASDIWNEADDRNEQQNNNSK